MVNLTTKANSIRLAIQYTNVTRRHEHINLYTVVEYRINAHRRYLYYTSPVCRCWRPQHSVFMTKRRYASYRRVRREDRSRFATADSIISAADNSNRTRRCRWTRHVIIIHGRISWRLWNPALLTPPTQHPHHRLALDCNAPAHRRSGSFLYARNAHITGFILLCPRSPKWGHYNWSWCLSICLSVPCQYLQNGAFQSYGYYTEH